jgi:hypothetical protein
VGAVGAVRADDTSAAVKESADRPHAVHVEFFGRGGLYSLGYDYQLRPWLAVGAAAAWYQLDGERVLSITPQANVYPWWRERHRWLVQGGPSLVRTSIVSPVPEWDGIAETGLGAIVASGYEYRGRVLVRTVLGAAAGKGGVEPWAGVTLGVTF